MWIGDVGQDRIEEIDFQLAGAGGRHYGWRRFAVAGQGEFDRTA